MENSKLRYSLVLIPLLVACGEITTNTTPTPASGEPEASESADPNHPAGNTAVILGSSFTDPIGTLSLLAIDEPREATPNVQTTHSDAAVRSFDNILYVVNRLGADNIQVVDPSQGFAVTQQFSTGQGTNPQDIRVTQGTRGYVSLYQPEDNNSEDLAVDDILVVNLLNGAILRTIDLTPFAADDGEPLPRASSMLILGERLFVALQDLPGDFSPPNQAGKIVVIDLNTDSVTGTIPLNGRNPVAIDSSSETGKVYVTEADYFDTSSPYGGIEIVDPETMESLGFLVDDLLLGGAPGDIEIRGSKGYVTVGFFDENFNFASRVIALELNTDEGTEPVEVYRSEGYIQDTAIDENGVLLVGDRNPSVNGILFIDLESNTVIDGPVNTGMPPSSITFINR